MSILSVNRIALKPRVADKVDAIRQAGQLLVESGCVHPEYVDGMVARELKSTCLGCGVAILNGNNHGGDHILNTGISMLRLDEGVKWDDEHGDVNLVFGIAATAEEHDGVLSNLAEIIKDRVVLSEILQSNDPKMVLNYLNVELLYAD
jgi:mannitol/fructose-specific phosphotransferase system IIA component